MIWTILWCLWALGFAVIEGVAIARHNWAGTLSDHLRAFFHTKTNVGKATWILLAIPACAWFVWHIAS